MLKVISLSPVFKLHYDLLKNFTTEDERKRYRFLEHLLGARHHTAVFSRLFIILRGSYCFTPFTDREAEV